MKSEYKSVMASDEEIKEFDKQQLEILLSDLKDIDKFNEFKDGAFRYPLTIYQANILIAYIDELKDRINKAVEHISNEFLCYDNESDEYIQGLKAIDLLKGDKK